MTFQFCLESPGIPIVTSTRNALSGSLDTVLLTMSTRSNRLLEIHLNQSWPITKRTSSEKQTPITWKMKPNLVKAFTKIIRTFDEKAIHIFNGDRSLATSWEYRGGTYLPETKISIRGLSMRVWTRNTITIIGKQSAETICGKEKNITTTTLPPPARKRLEKPTTLKSSKVELG